MIMGAGFHVYNRVSPEVSVHIINAFTLLAIMFGLETLKLTPSDYSEIYGFHKKLLHCTQHLPKATAAPALYTLTGSLPIKAIHHKNVLTLFGSMLRREGLIEQELFARQLAVKDLTSNSWTTLVKELRPIAFVFLHDPPMKGRWKVQVKKVVHHYWEEQVRKEAASKSMLQYLNNKQWKIGQVPPV